MLAVFSSGVFSKNITLGDILAVGIPLTIAFLIWFGMKVRHRRYRKKLLRLGFPDQWPVPSGAPIPRSRTVQLGGSQVLIGVALGSSTHIGHFDVRFVETAEGGNVDPNIIAITRVIDRAAGKSFLLPDEMGQEGTYARWAIPNASGGMDCFYHPPQHIDGQRSLFLLIDVDANQPFHGWLGFRGRDKNGEKAPPSHAEFTVVEPALPPVPGSNEL